METTQQEALKQGSQQLAEAQLKAAGQLPAIATGTGGLVLEKMPLGLRIWFDDALFAKCEKMAEFMSKAVGITPKHLIHQKEACFAVVTQSLVWNLNPMMVAAATYQTPGGRVGYEGKLVLAALEQTGAFKGPIKFEHFGTIRMQLKKENQPIRNRDVKTCDVDLIEDLISKGWVELHRKEWDAVRGKWAMERSQNQNAQGGDKFYAKRLWQPTDADGLGVRITVHVKGEADPRKPFDFLLSQCFPLNSTLWATDPETQIKYTGIRRFSSSEVSGIFMGVPFDHESDNDEMRVVSPDAGIQEEREPVRRPTEADFRSGRSTTIDVEAEQQPDRGPLATEGEPGDDEPEDDDTGEEESGLDIFNLVGERTHTNLDLPIYILEICAAFKAMTTTRDLQDLWQSNSHVIGIVPDDANKTIVDEYGQHSMALENAARAKAGPPPPPSGNDRRTPPKQQPGQGRRQQQDGPPPPQEGDPGPGSGDLLTRGR